MAVIRISFFQISTLRPVTILVSGAIRLRNLRVMTAGRSAFSYLQMMEWR